MQVGVNEDLRRSYLPRRRVDLARTSRAVSVHWFGRLGEPRRLLPKRNESHVLGGCVLFHPRPCCRRHPVLALDATGNPGPWKRRWVDRQVRTLLDRARQPCRSVRLGVWTRRQGKADSRLARSQAGQLVANCSKPNHPAPWLSLQS
jgi:hypothetical protein